MSNAWKIRRFWKGAGTESCAGGFTIRLDGRAVRTPARTLLVVPTLGLANAIAAEWDAQTGTVRPEIMPLTRTANSALDKVVPQFAEVAGLLAAYGGTDLLCYRALAPEALIARQAAAWDPLLDWSDCVLKSPLTATAGVIHIGQPPDSLQRLSDLVHGFSPFHLAALHDLIALSGSLVLALAVTRDRLAAKDAWALSRIDESWQAELWGQDEAAAELTAVKHAAFLDAARFFGLCG